MITANKMSELFNGPYSVVKDNHPNVTIIKKNHKKVSVHKDKVKQYFRN